MKTLPKKTGPFISRGPYLERDAVPCALAINKVDRQLVVLPLAEQSLPAVSVKKSADIVFRGPVIELSASWGRGAHFLDSKYFARIKPLISKLSFSLP